MTRLIAWWRARQLRIMHENARAAAASYMAAKARYENALVLAGIVEDGKP